MIADSLHGMGYPGVGDVRQGKYFELDVQAESADAARALVSDVSNRLLANPVIESFKVDRGADEVRHRRLSRARTAITTRITRPPP